MTRPEKILFTFLLGLFLALALRENFPRVSEWNRHFGGEYGNIAAALVRGEGYANPFEQDEEPVATGPTAWMPPLYVLLLALLFLVFGIKTTAAVWALLCLKYVALAFVFVLLFRMGLRTSSGNWPYLLLPIYLFHLRASYHSFFQFTHDVWLVMLILTLVLYSHQLSVAERRPLGLPWALLGGLSLLINPAVGLVFFCLTMLPSTPTPVRKRLVLLLVACSFAVPWTVRNLIVFGEFIPLKSNLFFDLYQANVLDEDGILTKTTFDEYHPHNNRDILDQYATLGESRFMQEYRDESIAQITADPLLLMKKALNRLVAATVRFPIFQGKWEVEGWTGRLKVITYSFPVLFGLYLVFAGRGRESGGIPVLVGVVLLFLLPYVIVGFYRRYRLPLTPVFCLIEFHFYMYLASRRAVQDLVKTVLQQGRRLCRVLDLRDQRCRDKGDSLPAESGGGRLQRGSQR